MKFAVIDAAQKTVSIMDYKDLTTARLAHGLKEIDFGALNGDGSVHFVVYEWSLGVAPETMSFLSIGRRLIAGNVVLFGVDDRGDTIDIRPDQIPPVIFYRDVTEVERMIKVGNIVRPNMAVNGQVIWQWNIDPPMVERTK